MSAGRVVDRRPTGYREHFDIGSDVRAGLSGYATEKEKRIVATRLELRFGEVDSREPLMMLGIIPSPRDVHAEAGVGVCSCGHKVAASIPASRVDSRLRAHITIGNRRSGVLS